MPRVLTVCLCLYVRYLSGSCLFGPSATQPAATCKASTTWSRRSSSSTSLSTSVSAVSPSCPFFRLFTLTFSCLMFCVICSRSENQPSPVLKVLLSTVQSGTFAAGEIQFTYWFITTGHKESTLVPLRQSLFSHLSGRWTPPTVLQCALLFPFVFFHLSVPLLISIHISVSVCVLMWSNYRSILVNTYVRLHVRVCSIRVKESMPRVGVRGLVRERRGALHRALLLCVFYVMPH